MAHFAELDENNIVLRVIVVDNKDILDSNGNESETIGIQYLKNIFGENSKWVQTSYNANFRYRPAAIGYIYDEYYDVFIQPKQYPSWVYNDQTYSYDPPIPYPNDGNYYSWNESTLSWDLVE